VATYAGCTHPGTRLGSALPRTYSCPLGLVLPDREAFRCDTRSTFATILWSRGEALSTIQTILGHADMRTTMGYIVGYHERGDEGASIEAAFASLPTFDAITD
jgi:hypothetical protein